MKGNNTYAHFSGSNPFGSQAKMLHHADRLHEYLSTGDTTPVFMEINPTNKCNLACKWCITETARGSEEIEISALEHFFSDYHEMGGKAVTFSGGGEPTQYNYFERAVGSAKKSGLELGLMTNGVFRKGYIPVVGENFEWARFSIDTLDSDKYMLWKGGRGVEVAQRNIKELMAYGVKVGVNCNVGEDLSVEEARNLIQWGGDVGVSYVQFRPILPRFFMPKEAPQLNQPVWEYLDSIGDNPLVNLSDDKRGDIENGYIFPFRSCEGHFFEPILDATGEVKICMYHPRDSRFTFGNIHEESFADIWTSNKRKEAIEMVRSLDYQKSCQMCCKLAEPNKLIDFLLHPEETVDINFL